LEFHFPILPGIREDCFCRLRRYCWKVEKVNFDLLNLSPHAQHAELEAEMGYKVEKSSFQPIDLSTRIANKFVLSAHGV